MVVPTIDTELGVLSAMRQEFANKGVEIVVSDPNLVRVARDKRITRDHFLSLGISSPATYTLDSIVYPAFAKPADGSLSRDTHILHSPLDVSAKILEIPNVMYSQYITPADNDEYTCDAYYSRNGNLCCVVPRQRLQVRGGEISKGITKRNELVSLFDNKLAYLQGARGCLTFQFFVNRHNRQVHLIELNPRFGGGFPISLAAGANYPQWLVAEYLHERVPEKYAAWQSELMALRYDEQVVLRQNR
jgi:carbamoyl-phosphate synthase large subunit